MKKLTSIVLALILAMSLACASLADEVPQPEGGRKFETNWAITGMLVSINYEEEGYRVSIVSEIPTEGTGTEWFYNCYYHPEDDTLVSVSSSKQTYTFTPVVPFENGEFDPEQVTDEDGEKTYASAEYEGLDDEDKASVFSIDEKGRLIWKDGHENAGADLEFINIGRFGGSWKNDDEGVLAMIDWIGSENGFVYSVVLQRISPDQKQHAVYAMTGVYNEGTQKLECTGEVHMVGEDGKLEKEGEECEAFFSMLENGGILYEAANGIELEPAFDSQG